MWTFLTFIAFTAFVAGFSWYNLRKDKLDSTTGYFLGGRSLTGIVIAGSMLLTNISTEHLVGMNGSSYKNGMVIIAWEVTSALALIVAAIYFVPRYLKMGLTTIPQYLEYRFDRFTRTIVAFFLIVSFVVTLLPIVLYTGAINIESIFGISELLKVSQAEGLWITVVVIGVVGSVYAIFGGLKAVAYSDTINGYGLLLGGLMIPFLALWDIGDGNVIEGMLKVYHSVPEKFNVVGGPDSVLPFEVLFTGLVINQLYFWCMHQTIVQRVLGAVNLKEAQKGLMLTGVLKLLIPFVVILPGIIGYYYFKDSMYSQQDMVYPELVKKVLPAGFVGLFAAVIMGAVLSTFNSVLNSAATLFSLDIYKPHIDPKASDRKLVKIGKLISTILAISAIITAPMVAKAPEGLYQLLQQLNGIFFIPIASVLIAGFFIKQVSALAAKVSLFTGLVFYVTMIFILEVDLHFVHVWGIEFLLNVTVMLLVSKLVPNTNFYQPVYSGEVDLTAWKYTKPMAILLASVTIIMYLLLN
ncbi:MAG: solute:sodium symporter family transporter [Bacteroidetes bacterium]|nr:solute:sodium symporter family transporter [Bacteroidota bacterium]